MRADGSDPLRPRSTYELARLLMLGLELELLVEDLDDEKRADTLRAIEYLAPHAQEPL